jgi:hypothetical protein
VWADPHDLAETGLSSLPPDAVDETPRNPRDTRRAPRADEAPSSGLMSGHLRGHPQVQLGLDARNGANVSGSTGLRASVAGSAAVFICTFAQPGVERWSAYLDVVDRQ